MIEILAAMVVISVVSAVSLPEINNFYSSDRCKAEAEKLIQGVRLAKYRSMQTQELHRLVFLKENNDPRIEAFRIDAYIGGEQMSTVIGSSGTEDFDTAASWTTILDEEEVWVDGAMTIKASDAVSLFFKPDGYIYGNDKKIISEIQFIYSYGNSAVAVYINALGVIGSEAFFYPENETLDDGDIAW